MSAKPQCPIMTSFLRYTLLLNTLYIWSTFVFSKKIWCFGPKFNKKFTKWVFREMITSENLQLISQRLSGPPFNKNYSMVSLDTMPPDQGYKSIGFSILILILQFFKKSILILILLGQYIARSIYCSAIYC